MPPFKGIKVFNIIILNDWFLQNMAFKMHLKRAMRAVVTFAFCLGLVSWNAVGETSNPGIPYEAKLAAFEASGRLVGTTEKKYEELKRAYDLLSKDQKTKEKKAELDAAKEEYEKALVQHEMNRNSLNQDQGRAEQLTQHDDPPQKGSGSSNGGMPPMPPPPKSDSKEKEEPTPQEKPKPETAQAPAAPPAEAIKPADPKEEALIAELKKQLADPSGINPDGSPKAGNEIPVTPTALAAQKLATDTVAQSEAVASKILGDSPIAELPKKATVGPIASTGNTPTRSSANQPRPQGLAGAMAALPGTPAGNNPADLRPASPTPQPNTPTQNSLRGVAASSGLAKDTTEAEAPGNAPGLDMASLLGGPAEAPPNPDLSPTALRSERLTRSVNQDRLVNPNAPLLPMALRAVMESNKLAAGTPASR